MSIKYPEHIEQQIREKAYEIWEYRRDKGQAFILDRLGNLREINSEDDYYEAEREILDNLELRK